MTDAVPNPGLGVQVVVSGASAGEVQIHLAGRIGGISLPNGVYVLTDPETLTTVTVSSGGPAAMESWGLPLIIEVGPGERDVPRDDRRRYAGRFAIMAVSGRVTLNGDVLASPTGRPAADVQFPWQVQEPVGLRQLASLPLGRTMLLPPVDGNLTISLQAAVFS